MTTATNLSAAVSDAAASAIRKRGLTQREVANASGIPLTTLHRKLSGKSPLTVIDLALICEVAGVSVLDVVLEAERNAAQVAA